MAAAISLFHPIGESMATGDLENRRLIGVLDNVDPNSPVYKAALFRIGTLVRNYAIVELTSKGAVDTGYLRSRIAFRIETSKDVSRVIVGAWGARYARMVEYGGTFTQQQRKAMFASFHDLGKPKKQGKGVLRGLQYLARPFLGPAFEQTRGEVNTILKNLISKSAG